MPVDDTAERSHHLRQLTSLVERIDTHGSNRDDRVRELRDFYLGALAAIDGLSTRLPRPTLPATLRSRWLGEPSAALETYAVAEGLW